MRASKSFSLRWRSYTVTYAGIGNEQGSSMPCKLEVLINAKVSFLESCNVNDSTMDGRLTTARALSSPRSSVLGRVFKSGAITVELDEIKS